MAFNECPKCEERIRVVDSRYTGTAITRRYRCDGCSALFHTREVFVEAEGEQREKSRAVGPAPSKRVVHRMR